MTARDRLRAWWHRLTAVPPCGYWESDPVLELLPDSRNVRYPESVYYVAADGSRHEIPKHWVSDGITSSWWQWILIGNPLTPKYRRPSGLHDVHVVLHNVSQPRSVELLRETLISTGTNPRTAQLYAKCVDWFGPQW